MTRTTGAMQGFDGPDSEPEGADAGLILLYADNASELPPAWVFAGTTVTIGREADSDVALPVSAVSRRHAEIVREGGQWRIRDVGSRNGVLVEGYRVAEAVLRSGMDVRVGDALLGFVSRDAKSLASYRIDGTTAGGGGRRAAAPSALVGGYRIDRLVAQLERIAPTTLNVLLQGESGTGKEVAAREIHRLSGRGGPFQAINCAALPENLVESELFGYRRGAFSGAERDKPGLIRAADGGTLLLDEIGDLPLELQAKLLRVIQTREVQPLGGTRAEPVDVRLICATHRDLRRMQADGRFRQDLLARIDEYRMELPPLRERKEDVYMLVRTFLLRHGRPEMRPSVPFMAALLRYDWPANVRELEACIKRCTALTEGVELGPELLPDVFAEVLSAYGKPRPEPSSDDAADGPRGGGRPAEEELREQLRLHGGNVSRVASAYGKHRQQIHRWMEHYGIDPDEYR